MTTRGIQRKISCTCLVLATAPGYRGRYVPRVLGSEHYQGISIHSTDFKNAKETLVDKGAKVILQPILSYSPPAN